MSNITEQSGQILRYDSSRTANEDGQRCCGQWDDKWRAGEQTVDHSSNALANDGLLDICQRQRSRNSAITLLLSLLSKAQSGAFTNFPSRAFIIQ